jgi:hypothetical protein
MGEKPAAVVTETPQRVNCFPIRPAILKGLPSLSPGLLGTSYPARQRAQKMNMVFDTTRNYGLALELGQNSAEVSVQFFAQ